MRWLVVLVGLSIATTALAQPTEPKPPFPITEVKLQTNTTLAPNGSVAVYEGTVDAQGLGYRLTNTSMLMPVSVMVTSLSELGVKVTIGKTWTEADRSLDTTKDGKDGTVTARYRTDDVSQITIAAAGTGTARFVMFIWVGEERTDYPDLVGPLDRGAPERARGPGLKGAGSSAKPEAPTPGSAAATSTTPPPSTPSTSPADTGSTGTSPVLWIIAGLLGALVVLGVVALRRRKS